MGAKKVLQSGDAIGSCACTSAVELVFAVPAASTAPEAVRERVGCWLDELGWPAGMPAAQILDAVGEAADGAAGRARHSRTRTALLRVVGAVETLSHRRRRVRLHVCDGGAAPTRRETVAAIAELSGLVDHVAIRWADRALPDTEVLLVSRSVGPRG
ncbi:hypothetical protein [Pseudonocardia sp. GCM10023141]|uniref:hypothetical protein n=1 Tax=Pseudonocardia sp. GCM10023141 TaxID=3252653 RepID=UPI0036072ED2